jgi:hypothetical protein
MCEAAAAAAAAAASVFAFETRFTPNNLLMRADPI